MGFANKVAKGMNNFFHSNHMQEVYKNCSTPDDVYKCMGNVLSFLIATKSSKVKYTPQAESLAESFENAKGELLINNNLTKDQKQIYDKLSKIKPNELSKNILENGFVTHSFNGYNLNVILKNGLGNNNNLDPQIERSFDMLESYLGASRFQDAQTNSSDEIYYTAPGAKTFNYACSFSPERLYLGILSQERDKAIPITLGETKSQYMSKVLDSKLSKLDLSVEQIQTLRDAGNFLINCFCTKPPQVALIPINSKHYDLEAHSSSLKYDNGWTEPLSKVVKEDNIGTFDQSNPLSFFTTETFGLDTNNLDDLVSHNQIVPAKDIVCFPTLDRFDILQKIALAKGASLGETIDYFSGEIVQKEVKSADKSIEDNVKESTDQFYQENEKINLMKDAEIITAKQQTVEEEVVQ